MTMPYPYRGYAQRRAEEEQTDQEWAESCRLAWQSPSCKAGEHGACPGHYFSPEDGSRATCLCSCHA